MQPRIGGSFAPPLTDAKLAAYKVLINALPLGPIKDALSALYHCCQQWWDLPEPTAAKTAAHPSGRGTIVALQADHAQALWNAIPWAHELAAMQVLFDGIDPAGQKDLRNAAFHLLWHVRELDLDREPLTADKL